MEDVLKFGMLDDRSSLKRARQERLRPGLVTEQPTRIEPEKQERRPIQPQPALGPRRHRLGKELKQEVHALVEGLRRESFEAFATVPFDQLERAKSTLRPTNAVNIGRPCDNRRRLS